MNSDLNIDKDLKENDVESSDQQGDSDSDFDDIESDEDEEESEEEPIEVPKSIKVQGSLVDISTHPKNSEILSVATLNGLHSSMLNLYKVTPGKDAEKLVKLKLCKDETRSISFSSTGKDVFCITTKKTLKSVDSNLGVINRTIHQIHDSIPYSLEVVDENILATGDENGTVKLWDLRHNDDKAVLSKTLSPDQTINNLKVDDNHRLLFALCSDGKVATFNARQRKFLIETEHSEFEPTAACTMKNNSKLAVSTDSGIIHLFNWNEFAAPSDSFQTGGGSLNDITRLNDNLLLAACDDGFIRAINILPNRVVSKMKHSGISPHKVVTTYDEQFAVSCSFDGRIRFFDLSEAKNTEVSDRDKKSHLWKIDKRLNEQRGSLKSRKKRQKAADACDPEKREKRAKFYSQLDSDVQLPEVTVDEDSSDDSSSSNEEES